MWLQAPGERYFRHDRDSWATNPVLPFQIHEESLEYQLEAEAKAASPLNFDHDDKENSINSLELNHMPNPVYEVSVMAASQHRRMNPDSHDAREYSLVNQAFFEEPSITSPYGLGGDGTQEQYHDTFKISVSDAMAVLASGAQLPCGSTIEDQADDIDSVLGMVPVKNAVADSVFGSDSVV